MTRPPATEPEAPHDLWCPAEHHVSGARCSRLAALCDGIHSAQGEESWFDTEETDR